MAGLSMSSLADLTATTLEDLPKLQFETPLQYQDYDVCNRWLRGLNIELQSGYGIRRNIMLKQSGNAEHVGLYESTTVNVADVVSRWTVTNQKCFILSGTPKSLCELTHFQVWAP